MTDSRFASTGSSAPEKPEAAWQEAKGLLAASSFESAESLLRQAAASGHTEAQYDLGRLLIFYPRGGQQRREGAVFLRMAEAAGHGAAAYLLAGLALGDVLEPFSAGSCNRRVAHAARMGHPEALRAFALHWQALGSPEEKKLGMLCLEHAALKGDIVSLALLCDRLSGKEPLWTPNPTRADAILALGARVGIPSALACSQPSHVPISVTAPPDLPACLPEADFFEASPTHPKELSASPLVVVTANLLSAEQCAFIIHSGFPYVRPSNTIAPDGTRLQLPVRTSHDMVFDPTLEDFSLRLIQRRMAGTAGLPLANAEWLTLLRYDVGQEYRPHRDYLPPSHVQPTAEGGSGQRQATVIAYLNQVQSGGYTRFPELAIGIPPEPGSALTFGNLDGRGHPDPRTLHAGEPVTSGTKWICTLWMREGRLRQL